MVKSVFFPLPLEMTMDLFIFCSYSDADELLVEGELMCPLWPQEHLNVDIITNEIEDSSNPILIGSEVEVDATTTILDILEGIRSASDIDIDELIGSAASSRQYIVWVACAALFTVFLL